MELVNQMLVQYPQLLYGGVGAAACLTGGALIYKITNRYRCIARATSRAQARCTSLRHLNNLLQHSAQNCLHSVVSGPNILVNWSFFYELCSFIALLMDLFKCSAEKAASLATVISFWVFICIYMHMFLFQLEKIKLLVNFKTLGVNEFFFLLHCPCCPADCLIF